MENIIFSLEDKVENNKLTLEELNTFIDTNAIDTNVIDTNVIDTNAIDTNVIDTNVIDTNAIVGELENYYSTNYNVKSLQQILQYYGIPKKNMVKDEMIQRIIFFEIEPYNKDSVLKRIRLWENISELKRDAYFAKYINFNV